MLKRSLRLGLAEKSILLWMTMAATFVYGLTWLVFLLAGAQDIPSEPDGTCSRLTEIVLIDDVELVRVAG